MFKTKNNKNYKSLLSGFILNVKYYAIFAKFNKKNLDKGVVKLYKVCMN